MCACKLRVGASASFEQGPQFSEGPSGLRWLSGRDHWDELGATWEPLGATGSHLGNHLGAIWGPLGATFGAVLGATGSHWGHGIGGFSTEMLQKAALGPQIAGFSSEMLQKAALGPETLDLKRLSEQPVSALRL